MNFSLGKHEKVGLLGEMKFSFKKGNKGENDWILLIETDSYEQVKYKDLFYIIKFFFDNEERIYPPPAKGSQYLLSAIRDLRTMTVDEVLLKYELRKADKIADFV